MRPRAAIAAFAAIVTSAAFALLFCFTATPTRAQPAGELPVEVQILEMVNLPGQSPRLVLRAGERVERVRVTVREGARRAATASFGSLSPGAEHALTWRAEPGVHHYSVEVSGRTRGGAATASVQSVVTVMRPLQVQLRREQVDLEERVLHFTLNNPAGRAALTIRNTAGRTIHEATTELADRPPGTRLELRWPALAEPIARMDLRVYDASDSWADFELVPFSIEIPHEDVVFETARADIRSDEEPKLEAAHAAILAAIRDHGRDMRARLYIMGHTDTVGSHADNLALSRRRAAAIARWFQARGGIALPILAQGFGETRPLVQTADDTDEPRNRRAQYILAAQAPVATNWTVVAGSR